MPRVKNLGTLEIDYFYGGGNVIDLKLILDEPLPETGGTLQVDGSGHMEYPKPENRLVDRLANSHKNQSEEDERRGSEELRRFIDHEPGLREVLAYLACCNLAGEVQIIHDAPKVITVFAVCSDDGSVIEHPVAFVNSLARKLSTV